VNANAERHANDSRTVSCRERARTAYVQASDVVAAWDGAVQQARRELAAAEREWEYARAVYRDERLTVGEESARSV
jgi:acyl-CoA thioesterase FadM